MRDLQKDQLLVQQEQEAGYQKNRIEKILQMVQKGYQAQRNQKITSVEANTFLIFFNFAIIE